MTCSFFGHSSCPDDIKPILETQIEDFIVNHNIKNFLLGDHGNFDLLVLKCIKKLAIKHDISYKVVLSYMPKYNNIFASDPNSIFSEELALVPKKFAINYRNRYLIEKSQYFITFITHSFGNAAKFTQEAIKKGKNVTNIADLL